MAASSVCNTTNYITSGLAAVIMYATDSWSRIINNFFANPEKANLTLRKLKTGWSNLWHPGFSHINCDSTDQSNSCNWHLH